MAGIAVLSIAVLALAVYEQGVRRPVVCWTRRRQRRASAAALAQGHAGACAAEAGSKRRDPFDIAPRTGYLSWPEYFMAVALLSAQRSKDPNKQVGACIVGRNHVILGIGYNGFPRGCDDKQLPWAKQSADGPLGTKYPYVVHAEANALLNSNLSATSGASIYVTMFPCNECAKLLIQAGIRHIIYFEGKDAPTPLVGQQNSSNGGGVAVNDAQAAYEASKKLLRLAGVTIAQYQSTGKVVRL